jgi:hypothetical protein
MRSVAITAAADFNQIIQQNRRRCSNLRARQSRVRLIGSVEGMRMKQFARLAMATTLLLALAGVAGAQSQWTPLNNQPGQAVGPMLQLRDGRILVHEDQGPDTGQWFILTPDATGSYVNGTWSNGGHLQAGYAPIYFGSQVLLNGKQVVIEGGEYNNGTAAWTNLGALGTIVPWGGITWVANSPPSGWNNIGDAESIVLANGKYMQSNCCTPQNAIFQGPNSWLATGSVNQSSNDESGFTLLPSGKILTVDTKISSPCSANGSELYDQNTGVWTCAASTPVQLYNAADEELGAAVLMYNGKVLQFGGVPSATAIYDPVANTWAAGPTPTGYNQADGPAALEPNGKVLAMLSPGLFLGNCQFMEYDPTSSTLSNAQNPANCPGDSSFVGHLMILPNSQIMFTDFSGFVEVYTPASGIVAAAKPTILAASTNLRIGSSNNLLYGSQLNGLSQNNAYGDDYQGETDYPLVRLTAANGNVYYAFTHDDSTHSIKPSTIMYTYFDLPSTIPAGKYSMQSVANGIGSNSVIVSVH